jgi:hypothetical protein
MVLKRAKIRVRMLLRRRKLRSQSMKRREKPTERRRRLKRPRKLPLLKRLKKARMRRK